MASLSLSDTGRYRLSVASRVGAAVFGGYALTTLVSLTGSIVLPKLTAAPPEPTVLAITDASFILYAALIIAAFSIKSVGRVWMFMILAAIPPGLVVLLLMPTGTGG